MQPKPYLGIYFGFRDLGQVIPSCKEGVFVEVAGVINGTPAAKAGLKANDIVLAVNGVPACGNKEHILTSFKKMIEKQEIGSVVKIDILRDGRRLSLTAPMEELPTREQPEAEHPDIAKCPDLASVLENALCAQNVLPVFNDTLDGLFEKSNLIHNPVLSQQERRHSLQLKEVTYGMRHPLAAAEAARQLSQKVIAPLHEGPWRLGDLARSAASLLDVELPFYERSAEVDFPALLRAMEKTKERVERALSSLTPEQKMLLQDKALAPWDDSQWNDVVQISMNFDLRGLIDAFAPLYSCLTQDNLATLKDDLLKRFGHNGGPVLYEAMTPIGKVIVGGPGSNVYTEDAALILDLGGDDLYLNNAGGTRPGMPVALVIDWGGNNRYISKEKFSQGAGVLGGGFLIDLGESATFVSLDGSQGAGFWGIGVLYRGDGEGTFTARRFSQGAGQMGIGLMANRRGDSRYLCSHDGQGLGLFGGAGILIDEGGNDFYQLGGLEPDFRDASRSTVSMGQGFGKGVRPDKDSNGVPGGIGMLIDEMGDDTRVADYFAQGASYYYGFGILNDMAGDDQYISGRYSQGAGIHSSVGVLLDGKGNDFYYASFGVAQGMGHDFGVGFLEDDEGDDYYWGGTLVQGAATGGGIGVFMDAGGHDMRVHADQGQAYASEEKSMGIMIGRDPETNAIGIRCGCKKE
jgi:hypothetical protein